MLKQQRDSLISMHEAQGMSPEELQGKVRLGVLVDLDKPEYCAAYENLIERAQKA
jgi:2-oxoglutarate ferredoxin oxidoreductase subunit beta